VKIEWLKIWNEGTGMGDIILTGDRYHKFSVFPYEWNVAPSPSENSQQEVHISHKSIIWGPFINCASVSPIQHICAVLFYILEAYAFY
jgi:hypothetical protein